MLSREFCANFRRRCFFIHIPKTGGTSLINLFKSIHGEANCFLHAETVLLPTPSKDVIAALSRSKFISAHLPFDFFAPFHSEGFLPITIVRDPISQFFSHIQQMKADASGNPLLRREDSDLIQRVLSKIKISVGYLIENMSSEEMHMFSNPQSRVIFDHVIKKSDATLPQRIEWLKKSYAAVFTTESLDTEVGWLLGSEGVNSFPFPKFNMRNYTRDILTPNQEAILSSLLREDEALFAALREPLMYQKMDQRNKILIQGQAQLDEKANSSMCLDYPSNQATVELLSGWVSKFPAEANVAAGWSNLCDDPRVTWALKCLGGAEGSKVLELGPLEASHTYMLEKAGAKHITSIEANKLCFLKCLIVKEILKLKNSEFLLGDFMAWLEKSSEKFDIIWAAGVLYHLVNPVELLHLIGEKADKVHIWTHYVPDDDAAIEGEWASSFFEKDERIVRGKAITHHLKSYGKVVDKSTFCGGLYKHATWLRRSTILEELQRAGFTKIDIAFENLDHRHGPAFAIAASK